MNEEAINENITDVIKKEKSMNFDFIRAIKIMIKILYKREYIKKKIPIYVFDKM